MLHQLLMPVIGNMCLQVWFIVSCASFAMMVGTAVKQVTQHVSKHELATMTAARNNSQLETLASEKKKTEILIKMAEKKLGIIAQAQAALRKS